MYKKYYMTPQSNRQKTRIKFNIASLRQWPTETRATKSNLVSADEKSLMIAHSCVTEMKKTGTFGDAHFSKRNPEDYSLAIKISFGTENRRTLRIQDPACKNTQNHGLVRSFETVQSCNPMSQNVRNVKELWAIISFDSRLDWINDLSKNDQLRNCPYWQNTTLRLLANVSDDSKLPSRTCMLEHARWSKLRFYNRFARNDRKTWLLCSSASKTM